MTVTKQGLTTRLALGVVAASLCLTTACAAEEPPESSELVPSKRYHAAIGFFLPTGDPAGSSVKEVHEAVEKVVTDAVGKLAQGSVAKPVKAAVDFVTRDLPSVRGAAPRRLRRASHARFDYYVKIEGQDWAKSAEVTVGQKILFGLVYYPGFETDPSKKPPHLNGLEVALLDRVFSSKQRPQFTLPLLRKAEELATYHTTRGGGPPTFFVSSQPFSFPTGTVPQKGSKASNVATGKTFYAINGYSQSGAARIVVKAAPVADGAAAELERLLALRREQVDQIAAAAVAFFKEHGRYPEKREELEMYILKTPLKMVPVDPVSGKPYTLRFAAGRVEILSYGADARKGGEGANSDIRRVLGPSAD
ncbi:MAG: type II secretion system protein GspG [Planctomycetota bacterium]